MRKLSILLATATFAFAAAPAVAHADDQPDPAAPPAQIDRSSWG